MFKIKVFFIKESRFLFLFLFYFYSLDCIRMCRNNFNCKPSIHVVINILVYILTKWVQHSFTCGMMLIVVIKGVREKCKMSRGGCIKNGNETRGDQDKVWLEKNQKDVVVEINGGVVSLGPFGSLQCDCIGLCCCNLVLKKNCCHIYLFIYGLNLFFFFFCIFYQIISYSSRSCWGWKARGISRTIFAYESF